MKVIEIIITIMMMPILIPIYLINKRYNIEIYEVKEEK